MTANQTPEAVAGRLALIADELQGLPHVTETCRDAVSVISALSAPVSGEAVAWRYRWPDQDSQRWEATTSKYLADRNTNLGAEIEPLGVLAAHPKPAGEGAEALREAVDTVGRIVGEHSDHADEYRAWMLIKSAILSTLSGGLGSRPATQAVPGAATANEAGQ